METDSDTVLEGLIACFGHGTKLGAILVIQHAFGDVDWVVMGVSMMGGAWIVRHKGGAITLVEVNQDAVAEVVADLERIVRCPQPDTGAFYTDGFFVQIRLLIDGTSVAYVGVATEMDLRLMEWITRLFDWSREELEGLFEADLDQIGLSQ